MSRVFANSKGLARRQFDFWLGDWDVRDATGKLVGRNRITRVQGGCALEEQWSGNGGVTGSSLNAYDAERNRWPFSFSSSRSST